MSRYCLINAIINYLRSLCAYVKIKYINDGRGVLSLFDDYLLVLKEHFLRNYIIN